VKQSSAETDEKQSVEAGFPRVTQTSCHIHVQTLLPIRDCLATDLLAPIPQSLTRGTESETDNNWS
jgi:hypothetical protein